MAPFYTPDPDDELLAQAGPGYVYLELPEYLLGRLAREGLDTSRGMIGPSQQIERSKAEVAKHDDHYSPENISDTLDLLARVVWKNERPIHELIKATEAVSLPSGCNAEDAKTAAAYHYWAAFYTALRMSYSDDAALKLLHSTQGPEDEEVDTALFDAEPELCLPWYLLSCWTRRGYRDGWAMVRELEAEPQRGKRRFAPQYLRRVVKRGRQS